VNWNSYRITTILSNALQEDKATSDATTLACIDAQQRASATIVPKQECIVAGLGAVQRILDIFVTIEGSSSAHGETTSHPEIFDGVRVQAGQQIAVIRHNARVLLACERVILNVLQRLSGIATLTRAYVDQVAGTKVRVLDTRKTVPGVRILDKYGVVCGGGFTHRLDLSDGVLIKHNHIALAGGIAEALRRAHQNRRGPQPLEIEVHSLADIDVALQNGAEAILLDHMSVPDVRAAVERCRQHTRRLPVEASGGITLENVRAYAETGVDFISVGALTSSARAVDISMRMRPA
jgi:nicotinate-nucleotide pyrophosphorylase (carboxylating)